jgi:hypothetical protein
MSGRDIPGIPGGMAPPSMTEDFTVADDVISVADTHHTRRSGSSCCPSRGGRRFRAGVGLGNVARRTLGIILLLVTVVLWTGSNFLASVSDPHVYCYLLTNSNFSPFSPTIPTQSRTSSLTSIHHFLQYRYSQYFSKLPIDMDTARSRKQQSVIVKAA